MNLTLHDFLKQKAEGMVDIILVKYRAICIYLYSIITHSTAIEGSTVVCIGDEEYRQRL